MTEVMRSDGKAVDITLTQTVEKGDLIVEDKFFGFACAAGVSGDDIALDISLREFEVTVGSGVTAAKGDILYITSAGVITNTSTSNKPCLKVTVAKDSNNVVWGILLPQMTNQA
jgi:predicted RecA/RadA family phage recombinase